MGTASVAFAEGHVAWHDMNGHLSARTRARAQDIMGAHSSHGSSDLSMALHGGSQSRARSGINMTGKVGFRLDFFFGLGATSYRSGRRVGVPVTHV
jgi:hypothetical protein